jgi:ferredoxin
MRLFSLDTRSALVGAGRSCVRNWVQQANCQACVLACPVDAVTVIDGKVHFDTEACINCGACQFTCPTGAVEELTLPLRHYRDDALVMPLSITAPSVDELLMWHAEYQIRAVELDMTLSPAWVIAIAALNIKLKQLKQPQWRILPPPVAAINKARRHWLQINNDKGNTGSVTPGWRIRRTHFPDVSEYQLVLNNAQCFLCGACARICPEDAIQLAGESMTLNHSRCTGCGNCEDVCFPHAIKVTQSDECKMTTLAIHEVPCSTCHRLFFAWTEQSQECPICQRHRYGMREA